MIAVDVASVVELELAISVIMVTSAGLAVAPDTLPITLRLAICCNLSKVTALALILIVVTAESASLPVVIPRSLTLRLSELISIVALSTFTSNVITSPLADVDAVRPEPPRTSWMSPDMSTHWVPSQKNILKTEGVVSK